MNFDSYYDGQSLERSQSHKPKWRKLLYIKQPYPDNYVDSTFLQEMEKNANVRTYEYWAVVRESGVITQHFSSIVIFICLFMHVNASNINITTLQWIMNVITLLGYLFWDLNNVRIDPSYKKLRFKAIKGSALFFITLLGLSPILKTLTQDTSDDTIWALTFCLFFVNLLFHDYGSSNISNIRYPGSLSTNAAVFASVLLASRLPSNLHVFGLMLIAVEWFALFPILRRFIKLTSNKGMVVLTILLVLLSAISVRSISHAMLIFYSSAVIFITFFCPFWLIWIQKYKDEIRGPWDEARLIINSSELR